MREVGIIVGGMRRAPGPAARIVLWTFLLAIAVLVLTAFLSALGPRLHTVRSGGVISCDLDQRDKVTIRVETKGRLLEWPWSAGARKDVPMENVRLRFDGLRASAMHVHLPSMGYRFINGSGQVVQDRAGFDEEALLRWMGVAGIDRDSAVVRGVAEEVVQLIGQTSILRGLRVICSPVDAHGDPSRIAFQPTGSSTVVGSPTWLGLSMFVFWAAVWLVGVWTMLRRHRLRVAGAEALPVSHPTGPPGHAGLIDGDSSR